MDALELLVLSLAAYRLTRLVTTDVITEPLRRRVWARWPDTDTVFPNDGTVAINPESPAYGTTAHGVEVFWSEDDNGWLAVQPSLVGYLVSCDWCAGLWVSAVVVAPTGLLSGWGWWTVPVWLAVGAVVGIVAELVEDR